MQHFIFKLSQGPLPSVAQLQQLGFTISSAVSPAPRTKPQDPAASAQTASDRTSQDHAPGASPKRLFAD